MTHAVVIEICPDRFVPRRRQYTRLMAELDEVRPATKTGVDDFHADDAESFLEMLNPRFRLWRDDPPSWIYRGQADAEWSLKPKAVRDEDAFAKHGIRSPSQHPGYVPTHDGAERRAFVNRLLEKFRDGLDRSGLVIPSPSPELTLKTVARSINEIWHDAYPLMALAQHHGLPTYLLDWTRRAFVAAYFAAIGAAAQFREDSPVSSSKASYLAVWAIKRGNLLRSSEGPNFYEAPGGTNPNLTAQAGLFSYTTAEDDPSIEEHNARLLNIIGAALPLRRVMMGVSHAPKLLRLLSYEGINGASMFPGVDGVAKAMRETALWDD